MSLQHYGAPSTEHGALRRDNTRLSRSTLVRRQEHQVWRTVAVCEATLTKMQYAKGWMEGRLHVLLTATISQMHR